MKKFITGAVVAAALLVAGTVSAASFTNVQFDNGDVTISGQGGTTVNATFHVTVPAGEVVEYIQTDIIGDSLASVDTSVGGNLGLQEGTHDITVPVKLPPNTGTYTLNVQGAGIYGGIRSINGNDHVVGSASFNGALRVVDSSNSTGNSNNGGFGFGSLADLIAAIKAALGTSTSTAPSTGSSAACAELSSDLLGAQMGVYNQANVKLQGFLLGKGASIPALAAGASFGFYGPQTMAAIGWFNTTNHCN